MVDLKLARNPDQTRVKLTISIAPDLYQALTDYALHSMQRPIAGTRPRLLKRGGQRDRGRVRDRLTERECRDLIAAARNAWEAGRPLNRFVTLAWGNAGIEQDAVAGRRVTAAWLKLARDWLGARDIVPWSGLG